MKKHVLRIREIDKIVFDNIKDGSKSVETRAATDKFRKIRVEDILVFVCGDHELEKKVEKVDYYKNIEEMVKEINFRSIMPFVDSIDEMKKVYFSFPNYEDKINNFGIVAFKLK